MTLISRAGLSALLAVALSAAACGKQATEEVETETVVPVTTEQAAVGNIRAVIHATGDVNPAPGAELVVTAPQPARIAEISKAEGDRVRRGEVLVRFDIPSLNADALSKAAEVTAAQSRVRTATDNVARLRGLFDRGVAARKEVDDAEKDLADAQAMLAQAEAGRSAAQNLAGRSTVTATFDGIIAKRSHNPGDLVDASASDAILRVIDPTRLQVDASVPIPDLSRIVVGAPARLVLGEDVPPLQMKVVSRPAAIEPGTAAAPVRLAFASAPPLATGTPVQVEIDAEEHANVVLVPTEAVVREADETAIYVASGNKAQRRAITLGIVNKDRAEVTSGLKAGETIITQGQAGLPNGATITTEKPGDKEKAEPAKREGAAAEPADKSEKK